MTKCNHSTWFDSFPEISTRPELVELMLDRPDVRRKVFFYLSLMDDAARSMGCSSNALRVFDMVWKCVWNSYENRHVFKELEKTNMVEYNQIGSVFKNAYKNWLCYIDGKNRRFTKRDVCRKWK